MRGSENFSRKRAGGLPPAPCRLFHSDAFFCKGHQQAVHVGRDGDGFSRGLNGVGHVLEAVAGDHTDHRVILADDALLADTARHIRTTTGKPLLATVRTGSEGGHFTGSPEDYARLVATLAGLDDVDAVDVEYRHPAAPETIASAHRASTAVIGSFHDFAGTPSLDAMVAHLEAMEQAGAQLCKLAVLPHNPEATARLLLATATRSRDAHTPLLTIAMGRLGLASRLCGRDLGSCASFAALDEHGSAPGQLPLDDLAQALSIVRHAER